MTIYVELDSKIIKACEAYRNCTITSKKISELFYQYSTLMNSIETRDVEDAVCAVHDEYEGIFWYPYEEDEQPEITDEIELETREKLMPYVESVEKLIIRGSEEGGPVTDDERAEWWKMQKQREREEFYKLNGYYEDEEQ